MKNEARGIIRELYADLTRSRVKGSHDMREVLQKVEKQLAEQPTLNEELLGRLTNYMAYTIFTDHLHLTPTQNMLVSQLMALGRRSEGGQLRGTDYGDKSQF